MEKKHVLIGSLFAVAVILFVATTNGFSNGSIGSGNNNQLAAVLQTQTVSSPPGIIYSPLWVKLCQRMLNDCLDRADGVRDACLIANNGSGGRPSDQHSCEIQYIKNIGLCRTTAISIGCPDPATFTYPPLQPSTPKRVE